MTSNDYAMLRVIVLPFSSPLLVVSAVIGDLKHFNPFHTEINKH